MQKPYPLKFQNMNEEWRPVVGWEGHYEVSSFGLLRNSKNKRPKTIVDNHGYSLVFLSRDGRNYGKLAHRAVAEAFLPNPEGKPQVNHIDGNKRNNTLKNLEWVTIEENWDHAKTHGLSPKGERSGRAKLTAIQVRRMRLMKEVTPQLTCVQIGKLFRLGKSAINYAINGTNWSHIS